MNKVTYNLKDGRQVIVPYNRYDVAPVSKDFLEAVFKELDEKHDEEIQFGKCMGELIKVLERINRGTREQALEAFEGYMNELTIIEEMLKGGNRHK